MTPTATSTIRSITNGSTRAVNALAGRAGPARHRRTAIRSAWSSRRAAPISRRSAFPQHGRGRHRASRELGRIERPLSHRRVRRRRGRAPPRRANSPTSMSIAPAAGRSTLPDDWRAKLEAIALAAEPRLGGGIFAGQAGDQLGRRARPRRSRRCPGPIPRCRATPWRRSPTGSSSRRDRGAGRSSGSSPAATIDARR